MIISRRQAITAGVKEYKSPTSIVWILGRIYRTGTPEDYAMVHLDDTTGTQRRGRMSRCPPPSEEKGADQAVLAFSFRYSVGVTPVVALKARLKGPSDWKPASIAMVMTGTSACAGSASAALASSIRWLLRKTLKLR